MCSFVWMLCLYKRMLSCALYIYGFVALYIARSSPDIKILEEALEKLKAIESTKFLSIAKELDTEDPYKFLRAYSPGKVTSLFTRWLLRRKSHINMFCSEPWAEMIFGSPTFKIICDINTLRLPSKMAAITISRNFIKWLKKKVIGAVVAMIVW